MEWGGDWFLRYKDADEMKTLVDGLRDVETVSLTIDSQGVYQYLEIKKTA